MKTIIILVFLVGWSHGKSIRRPSEPLDFIPIVRHVESSDNEGTYNFEFEGSDGSKRSESGILKEVSGQPIFTKSGHYSFITPEGIPIEIHYTSDENGYQARGSHLPTSPSFNALHVPESTVEEYEHSHEDYHHQSSSYSSSSYSPASSDSVNSPYEDDGAYSHIEYGENEFTEPNPSAPAIPTIPTTFFPTTTTEATPIFEHIVTHPTNRPPSVVSISPPPAPTVSLPPLPSPSPSVSVPKPNRPTFIDAPLVPILIGPAPVASKTFVQTPDFTFDMDPSKTMVRIGNV